MAWPLVPAGSMSYGMATACAGLLPLAAILYGAVRAGLRERRIPNQLVLTGIAAGLLLHSVLPEGNGFLVAWPGGIGLRESLRGLAIGGAAMFPFYRMRVVGAGDVKLMAAVGAILGPADIVPAIVGTLLAGGGIALIVTLRLGRGSRLLANFAAMARNALAWLARARVAGSGPIRPAAEAPYVLAVALGTLGGVLWGLSGTRF